MTVKTSKKTSKMSSGNALENIQGRAGIPLVTTYGNHMVFSEPKATTRPLPVITGPVTVAFKREDAVAGLAVTVGPVVVIDPQRYDAWLKVYGVARTNKRDETYYHYPFGVTPGVEPAGRYDLGWVTLHVAREIAAPAARRRQAAGRSRCCRDPRRQAQAYRRRARETSPALGH